jgi:hypothetical protein
MQGALFIELLTGNTALTIGIIIGSLLVVVGTLLFVINLFKQINANHSIGANKDFSA